MSLAPPAVSAPSSELSSAEFRQALGQFATGVTVVTACGTDGQRVGLTVSSFNSVSLQPPLILWSLNRASQAMPVFAAQRPYAIHVLGAHQLALAERFAGPREQRWLGLAHSWSAAGVPLLDACVARFECVHRSAYEEGDHVIFVAQVERCHSSDSAQPLLYHRGRLLASAEL
ncbi:MAG: flavin reductase family protein [Betaproteobacteria bacterium]